MSMSGKMKSSCKKFHQWGRLQEKRVTENYGNFFSPFFFLHYTICHLVTWLNNLVLTAVVKLVCSLIDSSINSFTNWFTQNNVNSNMQFICIVPTPSTSFKNKKTFSIWIMQIETWTLEEYTHSCMLSLTHLFTFSIIPSFTDTLALLPTHIFVSFLQTQHPSSARTGPALLWWCQSHSHSTWNQSTGWVNTGFGERCSWC